MKLSNRLPAEGINASDEHPLREFAWLTAGILAAVIGSVFLFTVGARWLAPKVPYRYEAGLAQTLRVDALLGESPTDARGRDAQRALQEIADRLARRMRLPEAMRVRVAFLDTDTVNAFATLGGLTGVHRGLIERLDSEDALAAVMAHEIAHLAHRHPAASVGSGLAVGLLLSMVAGDATGAAFGHAGDLTMRSFSRDQEREADHEAMRVVAEEYGHVGGAIELFETFERLTGARDGIEWLRTHPTSVRRTEATREWARSRGVPLDGARVPLPPALAALRRPNAAR
jgi:Zn-dependent protease with chaperone function